jgi:hypothetical protein
MSSTITNARKKCLSLFERNYSDFNAQTLHLSSRSGDLGFGWVIMALAEEPKAEDRTRCRLIQVMKKKQGRDTVLEATNQHMTKFGQFCHLSVNQWITEWLLADALLLKDIRWRIWAWPQSHQWAWGPRNCCTDKRPLIWITRFSGRF